METSSPFKKLYVETPSGQMHVRLAGDGDPVFLLHQAPSSGRQFEKVLPLFAKAGRTAIAPDYPGYGMSDAPTAQPTVADYADVMADVLDVLNIDTIDVVGHHTGAKVAAELALRHPEKVRGLVLHGVMILAPEERQSFLKFVDERERNLPLDATGEHFKEMWAERTAYMPQPVDVKLATRALAERFTSSGPLCYAHEAVFQHDFAPQFAKLQHPTLLLMNSGDMLKPYTEKAAELRPDFPYVEIPGGGIDAPEETPEAWTKAVLDFLDGLG